MVGEGGGGKTTLIRALRNQPFKRTPSTVGVATATVDTTALDDWEEIDATDCEKVTLRV